MLVISRMEAKNAGLRHYFTGKPCPGGHLVHRYVSSSTCSACKSVTTAEKFREYCRKWRTNHPDKMKASVKKWYEKNGENHRRKNRQALKEASRRWLVNHREQARIYVRKRRILARGADGHHTVSQILSLLKKQKYHCPNCGRSISDGYHVDHVIPLSRGGSNWISNIQLLCPPCNIKKAAKDPIQFAREQGRLL